LRAQGRSGFEIAVIGMAARFPGAANVDEYWTNLRDGRETISVFSEEELAASGIPPEIYNRANYVRAAGVLGDVEAFDAAFFGMSPRETEKTDPQHRLFLECAWEAMEHAGYDPAGYRGQAGVYAGVGLNTYFLKLGSIVSLDTLDYQALFGNSKDHLPLRVSYKLNLKGPSVAVQTSCSTSLVAVHIACRALLGGECDLALAGGVTARVPQKAGYLYETGGILSPDGHCRALDAAAQGTVFSSGAGAIVLRRLEDAERDGDNVWAVIKGSAINNDGSDKVGYAAPSPRSQAEVIKAAMAVAEVPPDTIGYVELHGTGTALGDPIELAGLTEAFRYGTARKGYCAIGSVKTNIGHTDSASGIAGLIKAVLSLHHGWLLPTLHFERANPTLGLASSPFYVCSKLSEWNSGEVPRRCGVSSFGIGGTNAHVIMEEAPPVEAAASSAAPQVLPLSAKTPAALDRMVLNLAAYLEEHEISLADAAFTLQTGRSSFAHRKAVIARNRAEAVKVLRGGDGPMALSAHCSAAQTAPVFLFPDSLDATARIDFEPYRLEPAFQDALERCGGIPGTQSATAASLSLRHFALQYAVASLLADWGIHPRAVGGAGAGEYVAACLAGVLSLDDALRLTASHSAIPGGPLVRLMPPRIPCLSGLTCRWLDDSMATDWSFWSRDRTNAELDREALCAAALHEPDSVFLEVGRHTGARGIIAAFEPDLQHALAQLWLAGVEVDWRACHKRERRRRVPLPAYPFERKRYTIESARPWQLPVRGPATQPRSIYASCWQECIRSAVSAAPVEPTLLLLGESAVGSALAERFAGTGCRLVRVTEGHAFGELSAGSYTIRHGDSEDYRRLFTRLASQDFRPARIVHLLACENHSWEAAFYNSIAMMQALGPYTRAERLELDLVTSRAFGIDTAPEPGRAALLSLAKVIPYEYRNVRCRAIEIPNCGPEDVAAARLFDELLVDSGDDLVSLAGQRIAKCAFVPLDIPDPAPGGGLRRNGVYLVTGGLGHIGKLVAEHLARTVQAKLVLTGRSGQAGSCLDLENLGAEVLFCRADAGRVEEMRAALAAARERFGGLNGCIHCAGIKTYGAIASLSRERCEEQFRAASAGLRALEEATEGLDLDFCLIISSLSAVAGGPGLAAYAAAHAYMNAFVDAHNRTGRAPWRIANWDNWLTPQQAALLRQANRSDPHLVSDDAISILNRLLPMRSPSQLFISADDLNARVKPPRPAPSDSVSNYRLAGPAPGTIETRVTARAKSQKYVAPRTGLERAIAGFWSEALGVERIGIEDDFFELGGDSVAGIQILSRMRDAGMPVDPQRIFEYRTVADLAAATPAAGAPIPAEQGRVSGPVPLSPIQRRFLELHPHGPGRYCQTMLMESSTRLDPARLRVALERVTTHHDALRLRFARDETGWRQFHAAPEQSIFEMVSFTDHPDLARLGEELRGRIDISAGPLVQIAHIGAPEGHRDRLMIAAHHLVMDALSWGIFAQDLETAYRQLADGLEVNLPVKTTSFQHWSRRLAEYAKSPELEAQTEYWLGQSGEALGGPAESGATSVVTADTVPEVTRALLRSGGAPVASVLLTALAHALAEAVRPGPFRVHMEGHGRDFLFGDTDLSRTVGWFTALYPVGFDAAQPANPLGTLHSVSQRLHSVPQGGIGYGVLRYLTGGPIGARLSAVPEPEIGFLFVGKLDAALAGLGLFRPILDPGILAVNRSHSLEVVTAIVNGVLRTYFFFDTLSFPDAVMRHFASSFESTVHSLAAGLQQQGGSAARPSSPLEAGSIRQIAPPSAPAADRREYCPLVAIKPSGHKQKLFCVHPAGGTALCYLTLAELLDPDRPFYGLEAPILYPQEQSDYPQEQRDPPQTLEAVAAGYRDAMCAAQPRGPYLLAGWSMGGSIAYEIALQLQEMGENVPFLALFDSRAEVSFPFDLEDDPENTRAILAFALATASYLGKEPRIDLAGLEQQSETQRWSWILAHLSADGLPPALFDARDLAAFYHVWRKGLLRLSRYEPRPRYRHSIRLFRAQDPAPPEIAGLLNTGVLDTADVDRWRRLSGEPLTLYEVPGNHFNMMQAPHVNTLAPVLRAALDSAG